MSLKAILELQFCQKVKYLVDVNTHSLLFEEHRLVCPADTVWDPWGRQELRISWTNNQRKYAAQYTQGHSLLPDTVENITIWVDSNIHIGNYYLMFLCLLLISEEGVWHPNFGRVCQSQVVQLPWNSFTTVNKKLESKHTVAENILRSVNCLQSFNYFHMIFTILEDIIYLRPEADTVDLLFSFFIHPGMNFNK